jgi:hypothetical protein
MSVTDPKNNRIIFCEGQAGSPDILLWRRILIDTPLSDRKFRVDLKPMAGKQAAKNFAAGYTLATQNENWIILRDRDLDAESAHADIVRWDRGKVILTGGTSIESYFLLPDLLEHYIRENNLKLPETHAETLPNTIDQLKHYQAVRWALQRVRKRILNQSELKSLRRAAGQFDLPNRLTDKDGELPKSLDLDTCIDEARTHLQQFRDVFHVVHVKDLEEAFEEFVARFESADFLSNKSYFQWFHGKDILKRWLGHYANVGHTDYCEWAANNVDWQQFPDLVEMQHICQTEVLPAEAHVTPEDDS